MKINRSKNLKINYEFVACINHLLENPDNILVSELWEIVEKYGGVKKINKAAKESGNFYNLMERLKEQNLHYADLLSWLEEWRDQNVFISIPKYREKILGAKSEEVSFRRKKAVTLEISALQYFPWLIEQARNSFTAKDLMPGRFIRVRRMKEQEADGDLLAVAAAMKIIGASWVETLDTKGADGSNIHLNLTDPLSTLAGFFTGIGQPNEYVFKWVGEFLYYYTNYGVKEVLNFNLGTILAGFWLYKWGIDISFKISVFAGIDNPFSAFAILVLAKLFSNKYGVTPLRGFNLSNSVNNQTIKQIALFRKELGFETLVRIEHHITEAFKNIVRQPYDRIEELVELAKEVPNLSAKHEGASPETDSQREHPSDIFDYFKEKTEIGQSGQMHFLETNYFDKHLAVQRTASILTQNGIPVICARNLHHLA